MGGQPSLYVCDCGDTFEPRIGVGNSRCPKCAQIAAVTKFTCKTCKTVQKVDGNTSIPKLLAEVGDINCEKCAELFREKMVKREYKYCEYISNGKKHVFIYRKEEEASVIRAITQ